MDNITKLRNLIWDSNAKVFTNDNELQEYLNDCGGNVYRTAALVLDIVRANPERKTQYKRGGVSVTKQNLDAAINRYEQMAGDSMGTITTDRVYVNDTTKR